MRFNLGFGGGRSKEKNLLFYIFVGDMDYCFVVEMCKVDV